MGRDTTVGGVPASWYEGGQRLEIYFPGTTVIIFGQNRDRISRVAHTLRKGLRVLARLSDYGFTFERDCITNVRYCIAEPEG